MDKETLTTDGHGWPRMGTRFAMNFTHCHEPENIRVGLCISCRLPWFLSVFIRVHPWLKSWLNAHDFSAVSLPSPSRSHSSHSSFGTYALSLLSQRFGTSVASFSR